MHTDLLSALRVPANDVAFLPPKARDALIGYLLRWKHFADAVGCLEELLAERDQQVTFYDRLAAAFLGLEQPQRAVEIMQRRLALRPSVSAQVLLAQAHLAGGDLSSARAIADRLLDQSSGATPFWSLQAEVALAAGDREGAAAAVQAWESLRPQSTTTAHFRARLWHDQGDSEKALLWAHSAVSYAEGAGRRPSVELLRLLECLYKEAGQPAQAEATTSLLSRRQTSELEGLRQLLGVPPAGAGPPPQSVPPHPAPRISSAPTAAAAKPEAMEIPSEQFGRLLVALQRTFPHRAFRPGQAEVLSSLLEGNSTLAVMPTGAGKSLCYQLASTLLSGTTLVISPLIALMKDQIDGLPESLHSSSTTLNHTLDGRELDSRLAQAGQGRYRLLYAAPERLRQRPFLHALAAAGVSLLVVDEAHCVSLWGHDFRPDYLFLAKAWHELGRPPILAMTATATPRVRDDIAAALGDVRLIATDIHRPNLHLEAHRLSNEDEKERVLLAMVRELGGSGIVYATSREKCERLAAMLRQHGVSAIHYHAGVDDRAAAQDRFMSGAARVVVATVAFGMGIDKADVRFVIHYNPPKTLENYFQEAGRAGRDGLPARCVLFHSASDQRNLTSWVRRDALDVELLRAVYRAVQRRVGAGSCTLIPLADLERDLGVEETRLRVAVHFLEAAGLLWRGFDLPRTSTLTLLRPTHDQEAEFCRFVEAARLRPAQTVSRDTMQLGHEAHLDACTIESTLLDWQRAGWLEYRGTGRDMLIALPTPPQDSQERVAAMLADYHSGQKGRIAEIMAYAATRACRHGHISAHFGGQVIDRCQACDNCTGLRQRAAPPAKRPPPAHPPAPAQDVLEIILRAVSQLPFALGRTGLSRALAGLPTSPVQANRFPLFGALSHLTRSQIDRWISELADDGLLVYFESRGYRLLQLTDRGRTKLVGGSSPQPAAKVRPGAVSLAAKPESPSDEPADFDRDLFDALGTWRREAARRTEKPPHFIFHAAVLKRIAATQPKDLGELAAVKGVGPHKLAAYGDAVLAIVAAHRAPATSQRE